jgi:hypothetical protein
VTVGVGASAAWMRFKFCAHSVHAVVDWHAKFEVAAAVAAAAKVNRRLCKIPKDSY